jgi:hypothetical protein
MMFGVLLPFPSVRISHEKADLVREECHPMFLHSLRQELPVEHQLLRLRSKILITGFCYKDQGRKRDLSVAAIMTAPLGQSFMTKLKS